MISEERISNLEREIETLKFWHFNLTRKTAQTTAMGVQAVIEFVAYRAESGQQVFMNGSLSRGTIQRYTWEQTGGPSVSHTNFDPTCVFIAPSVNVPTALTFALTVTDSSNQTSRADVLVHVKPVDKEILIDYCPDCGGSFKDTALWRAHLDTCCKKAGPVSKDEMEKVSELTKKSKKR